MKKAIFIFIFVFFVVATTYAKHKCLIPEAFGDIYIGMSTEEFEKKTGVEPSPCVECGKHELQADIYLDDAFARRLGKKSISLKNASITYQTKSLMPRYMSCYFYKGHLYRIVMSDVVSTFESVRRNYTVILGKPQRVFRFDDQHMREVCWEDNMNSLCVVYSDNVVSKDFLEISYSDIVVQESMAGRNTSAGVN